MKDSTRRRIFGASTGLLLLLLISCNVMRAINGPSRAATAPPPGTLPLVTGVLPSAAQVPAVPQQIPATTEAAVAKTASGAPSTGAIAAVSATTPVSTAAPAEAAAQPPAGRVVSPAPAETTTPLRPVAAAVPGATRPNPFSAIQGNTLRATGAALSGAAVRLRDARYGRIVGTQTSDESGAFAFSKVDPGVYIVEMVGNDQSVLAASQMLNVTAGETASTSVRLPFRSLPLGGVLGDSPLAAAIVAAEAAAAGVLSTTATEPVSPTQ